MIRRRHYRCRLGGAVVGLLSLFPALALALDTSLTAPGAPEEVVARLTGASQAMAAPEQEVTDPQEILALALSDYRTLVQVLYDEGYFSPTVSIKLDGREAGAFSPLNPPSRIGRVAITVNTGAKFSFGRADISPLAPDTEIPDSYRVGQPASTGVLRDAAVAGIAGWRRSGHAKVDVGEQRITANHTQARLDADIRLSPGPKLRFGKMYVKGKTAVREEAILRIAGFPTGEVFHPDSVQTAGRRLRRTGTFSSVAIKEQDMPNADGTLDFDAVIVDQKQRRISFGFEVSSEQGMDLTTQWTHRNFFGGAERLKFDARIGNLGGSEDADGLLAVRLDRPAAFGADRDMFYLASLDHVNEPYYSATTALVGVGVKRIYSEDYFAELSIGGMITDVDDAFGKRRFDLLTFSGRAELDKRDNKISATRGYYLDFRGIPYYGFSGSQSGMTLFGDGRAYLSPFGSDRIVLAGRLQIGSTVGASLPDIPPQFLFYSGGAGTVRGQPYQSLGIPVGTETSGGRALMAASAELRGKITPKVTLVGFYDIGAVDIGQHVTKNSPYHSGAGLGVRYDLGGIGALRFDVGYPTSGATGDGVQIYLGIGQAF